MSNVVQVGFNSKKNPMRWACALHGRPHPHWPSGIAHEFMMQLIKEYEPDDTRAEMEMKKALSKLSLGKNKDPNDKNNEISAIECRYKLDLTKSKKKARIFRIGTAQHQKWFYAPYRIVEMFFKLYRQNIGLRCCSLVIYFRFSCFSADC